MQTKKPARTEQRRETGRAPRPAPQTVDEVIERMADPETPTPTQEEANEIKADALGVPDEGEPPTEAPAVVDVPHVAGNGVVGETLTCTLGNWTGTPSSYAYQWQRDGADFAATGDTYVIAAEDDGHSLSCVVTATNAIGSTTAPPSNAVAVSAAAAATASTQRAMRPDRTAPGYPTR
jgi:hypothetical protein